MRWPLIGKLFAIALATILWTALFHRFADVLSVGTLMAAARPQYLATAAAITCLTTLLRALRASVAVSHRATTQLMAISVVHNAVTALLPMKVGEFALPMLLARAGYMKVPEGFGLLILLRMFDLVALGLVGSLAIVLAFQGHHSTIAFLAWLALASSCVLVLVALSACKSGRSPVEPIAFGSFGRRLLAPARQLDHTRLATLGALSVSIWLSLFSAFHFVALSLDDGSRYVEVASAGAAASIAFAVPAAGIANMGPFQMAWVWMSGLFGIAPDQALTTALLAHATVLAVTLVVGTAAAGVIWPVLRQVSAKAPQE